jgi:hypothetical protein
MPVYPGALGIIEFPMAWLGGVRRDDHHSGVRHAQLDAL